MEPGFFAEFELLLEGPKTLYWPKITDNLGVKSKAVLTPVAHLTAIVFPAVEYLISKNYMAFSSEIEYL